jgi:MFS transporter, PAT family, beta-lactamase induction signal transducer AmpG
MFRSISVYLHPKVLAVFFLGFASGLPLALTGSTITVWLTEIGVNITTIGLFAAVSTPYALKFLWAPFVDQLRLPVLSRLFGQRRSWMILSQLTLMALIALLGGCDPYENPWRTAMIAVMVAIASATQDIVIDAYRVELLKPEQQGAGAAMSVFGYRVGMLVSGAGALFLAEEYSWPSIYNLMAACVGVGILTVLVTGEPRRMQEQTLSLYEKAKLSREQQQQLQGWFNKAVINPLADFLRRKYWLVMLLFVVFFKFGDALAGVMTNPFLIETGFSKSDIAMIVKTYGFFATLTGAFIGGVLVYRLGMIKSLWICGILQMLSNLMFAVQATVGYDKTLLAFTIGIENFASGMGTAAFVAYLSSLCNLSYTATQYALLSSLASVGRTWLSTVSGFLVEKLDWFYFFVVSTLAAIPGLILLAILSRHVSKQQLANANHLNVADNIPPSELSR